MQKRPNGVKMAPRLKSAFLAVKIVYLTAKIYSYFILSP